MLTIVSRYLTTVYVLLCSRNFLLCFSFYSSNPIKDFFYFLQYIVNRINCARINSESGYLRLLFMFLCVCISLFSTCSQVIG